MRSLHRKSGQNSKPLLLLMQLSIRLPKGTVTGSVAYHCDVNENDPLVLTFHSLTTNRGVGNKDAVATFIPDIHLPSSLD